MKKLSKEQININLTKLFDWNIFCKTNDETKFNVITHKLTVKFGVSVYNIGVNMVSK